MVRLVPLNDDVAVVGGFAGAAKASPKCVTGKRPGYFRSSALVKHGVTQVHPLHYLGVTDRGVGIRRGDRNMGNARTVIDGCVTNALEAQADRGTNRL